MGQNLIPYLATLDMLDLSSSGFLMEDRALRLFITHANWSEYPYKPITSVDLAYNRTSLYARFIVRCKGNRTMVTHDGGPVHEDSCVELFLQIDNSSGYFSFEFNPIGYCNAAYRHSREDAHMFTPEMYEEIKRHTSQKISMLNESSAITSWELVVSIPFSLLGLDPCRLPEMRANFYKCGDLMKNPHFVSWNPIMLPEPNFHCVEYFAPISFAPENFSIEPHGPNSSTD